MTAAWAVDNALVTSPLVGLAETAEIASHTAVEIVLYFVPRPNVRGCAYRVCFARTLHSGPAAFTNSLATEIRAGRFLEDFYCALATIVIELPPLRDRGGDLGWLVERLIMSESDMRLYLRRFSRMRSNTTTVSLIE